MWRFILLSFAFLGWSFYELSGGADYAPGDDSLQAHWAEERERRANQPVTVTKLASAETAPETDDNSGVDTVAVAVASGATDDAAITAALSAALEQDKADGVTAAISDDVDTTKITADATDRVEVTLASASDLGMGFTLAGLTANAAPLPGETAVDARAEAEATEVATPAAITADIRYVAGNRVNMRAGPGTFYEKVDQLTQGTQVTVLDATTDGWLRLRVEDTGTEGWMADWLVTAAN